MLKKNLIWGLGLALVIGILYSTGRATAPVVERSMDCADGIGTIRNPAEMVLSGIPPQTDLTVTVIGLGRFDPVLVLQTANGQARCIGSERGTRTRLDLPSTGRVRSSRVAQFQVQSAAEDGEYVGIYIGERRNRGGSYVLLVDGLVHDASVALGDMISLNPSTSVFRSPISPTAYMVATSDTLDPAIAMIGNERVTDAIWTAPDRVCDDAGQPERCPVATEALDRLSVTITGDTALSVTGDTQDAMFPVDAASVSGDIPLNLFFASVEASQGSYLMLLHAGLAPS